MQTIFKKPWFLLWLCCCGPLQPLSAEPAPWYQWQSQLNQRIICRQTTPGFGWQQVDGPYKDARCQHRLSRFNSV